MAKIANEKRLSPRPPIVVVVGHVDHGKTTLLDYIRKSSYNAKAASPAAGEPRSVAEREAGGITQAVGAYEISRNGRRITFIDTPGHEAFSKMRSRGAEIADLAILVIAADEGVKPQTKEAIEILNSAKTPFVVAINKVDKTGGNVEKAANDLAAAGVYLEGRGGQVSFHGISAKTGEGVSELLDLVLLATDVENLTYDPAAPTSGYVLEVRHDSRRGTEATMIVKDGVLRKGSEIYTKSAKGKAKILEDFLGNAVTELSPSAPALVVGFENPPQVGEIFSTDPSAVAAVPERQAIAAKKLAVADKEKATLNLILKAADAGSLEALSAVIKSLPKGEKTIDVVYESVGNITDGDVKSAIANGAAIIGFKNKVDKAAKNLAQAQEVKIITSEIIYDSVKAVEEFLATLGKPAVLGELEVLAVFNQEKLAKQLIGGRVASGVIRNKAAFEVADTAGGGKTTAMGRILSMREKKSELTQAEQGEEVGLYVNYGSPIKVGDRLVVRK